MVESGERRNGGEKKVANEVLRSARSLSRPRVSASHKHGGGARARIL